MTYKSKTPLPCVVCGAPSIGRKLCRRCYRRERKAGNLQAFPVVGPADVFLQRFEKTDACWLWTGGKNGYGYGIFIMPGEKKVRAHRFAYEWFKGPIPAGLVVRHTCDNPPCVNPDHLVLGTTAENNADTARRARHNYGTNHWNGRISREVVAAIKASDETQAVLAARYGVDQSYISGVKSGRFRRNG